MDGKTFCDNAPRRILNSVDYALFSDPPHAARNLFWVQFSLPHATHPGTLVRLFR